MNRPLKYLLGIVVLATIGTGIVWAFIAGKAERDRERERELPVKAPARLAKGADGSVIVTFDKATQDRAGLRSEALTAKQMMQEIVALGRLAEDPAESFIVRAPLAGTLQPLDGAPIWSAVGTKVEPGAVLATLLPRLGAVEQVDLQTRLATAQADVQAVQAALVSEKATLARLRGLNAQDKNISDRAVQEAEAAVKADEAKLAGAQAAVDLLQRAIGGKLGTGSVGITAVAGGSVVEVNAHPGEAVEAGQPIVRFARFDRLLATVVIPPEHAGTTISAGIAVRVVGAGSETDPLSGTIVGEAPVADSKQPGRALLIRVDAKTSALRPGMSITAYVPIGGSTTPPREGVLVPRETVVRHQGRAWVYLQTGDETFTRREVVLDTPTADAWFVASLKSGDRIVTAGAQVLLSEELKSQIQILEEGEGK